MKKLIFLLVLYSGMISHAAAQWQSMDGPLAGPIISLAINGPNVFAGTEASGVFLSVNNGAWNAVSYGLPVTRINALAIIGSKLFAALEGPFGGVFISADTGKNWMPVSIGLPRTNVYSLAVSGTTLFAGTDSGGVYISSNNGTLWTAIKITASTTNVKTIVISGPNIFAGTFGDGVFLSSNNGFSWTPVNNGLTNKFINTLAIGSSNIFAGTDDGIFTSSDTGNSWTAVNNGLTSIEFSSLAASGSITFAGSLGGGVDLSANNGGLWTAVNNGLNDKQVLTLSIGDGYIYAGARDTGVWKRPLSDLVGMNEIDRSYGFSVYPVPATSRLSVQMPSLRIHEPATITVINSIGEKVSSYTFSTGESSGKAFINIETLAQGIYVVQVTRGNNTWAGRFVKE